MTGLELLSALAKSGTGAEKLRIVGAECGPHTTADEVVGRFQALGHRGTVEKATTILALAAYANKPADDKPGDKPGKKDKATSKADPSDKADDSAAGEKDKAGSKPADEKPGDKPPAQ